MRRVFGVCAFIALIFFSTLLYAAEGDNVGEPLATKITEKQGEIGSGGDFTYSVDFDIPAFRGLEPDLGLDYSSSRLERDEIDGFVGFGWRLRGLSIIQRQSLGGGVPTYNDGADVYEIDGRELLACATAWTRNYPPRYRADKPSPSCSHGGNLTARVEDYTRYFFDTATNKFIVTHRDGVRFEYTSLGEISGEYSAAGTPERRFAYNTYWFLTSISDTQRDGGASTPPVNKVTISYVDYNDAGSVGAFGIRPSEIIYAGYKVKFGYTKSAKPLAQFPTSTPKIGEQRYLLKSVAIYSGSAPVRAYDLRHTTSATLATWLLSSVRELGADFAIEPNNGVVTSGSELPATTFEYSSDAFSFAQATYTDVEFHEVGLVYDKDSDGQDELVLFPWEKHRRQEGHDVVTYPLTQAYLGRKLSWGGSKDLIRNVGTVATCSTTGAPVGSGLFNYGRESGIYVENDRSGNRTLCYATKIQRLQTAPGEYTSYTVPTLRNFETANGAAIASIEPNPQLDPRSFRVVNLDLDPEIELTSGIWGGSFGYTVHDVEPIADGFSSGALVQKDFIASIGQDALIADFTGDGVTDSTWLEDFRMVLPESTKLASTTVSRGTSILSNLPANQIPGTGAGLPAGWPIAANEEKSLQGIGDFNGDGINDVSYLVSNYSGNDQLYIYYGTGRGFAPVSVVSLNNLLTAPRVIPGNNAPRVVNHRSEITDINADGLSDLIVHEGFSYEPQNAVAHSRFVSKNSWVFLNKGNGDFRWVPLSGQVPAGATLPGFTGLVFTGDFNGDGLKDIVREGASGRILYGSGVPPNRLKVVHTSLGSSISVSYTPSSAFGETRIPFVQSLVTKIDIDDGRGQTASTSYTYSGGAYDFLSREPLGYRTVTARLPKIGNETVGPVVKRTYFVDSLATSGAIEKEEKFSPNGTLMRRTVNGLATQLAGNGPYMGRIVETTDGYRSGIWIETKSARAFNSNGLVTVETDFGATSLGQDVDPKDNRSTSFTYASNPPAFILDRLRSRRLDVGASNESNWVAENFYYYDDPSADSDMVTEGNLVLIKEVNRSASTSRNKIAFTYDAFGNVKSETDANGNVASHEYDAYQNLFRVSTTNAIGDTTHWTWDAGCQSKISETDSNLQQTNYTYDTFCREIGASMPGGQLISTSYLNFGNPMSQRVVMTSKSASLDATMSYRASWEYFDGLGRVYISAHTNANNTTTTASPVTYRSQGYDARGNLLWQSIPRFGSERLADPDAIGFRTDFTYDALDRETLRVLPDGTQSARAYTAVMYQSSPATVASYHAGLEIRDAHCYDDAADETACGPVTQYQDAFGNNVLEIRKALTITDAAAAEDGETKTHFRFDGLDRLVGVTDPIGAIWSYTYDGWGDRVQAIDPDLGAWNLTYDVVHNLTKQVDAKGQQILLSYNEINQVIKKTVGSGSTLYETYFSYGDVRTGAYNKGRETVQEVYRGNKTSADLVHKVERDYFPDGKIKSETHYIDGRVYSLQYTYAPDGSLLTQMLPLIPNSTAATLLPALKYDAASRVIGMDGYIDSITYDPRWGSAATETLANGVVSDYVYDAKRGWLTSIEAHDGTLAGIFAANYTRTATGRIDAYGTRLAHDETDNVGSYSYTYDAAGRLLTATALDAGQSANSQVMTYDSSGRIRSKGPSASNYLTYTYPVMKHAPSQVGSDVLTYDENGNMETAPGGRSIAYDGENRPISVTKDGVKTCYIYGVDGARLKKIGNLPASQNCATVPALAPQTVYFGPIEIESFKLEGAEKITAYPHPSIKLTAEWVQVEQNGLTTKIVQTTTNYLHRDHLGSVRAITGPTGARLEATVYRPYGERVPTIDVTAPDGREDKGWIGERFDPETGLQYLNARYYDPFMGMFIQPDWWEVNKPGVGTNRYAYSFGDPVNKMDPGGNAWYNDWGDFKGLFSGSVTKDLTGRTTIQSAPILRAVVPGQVAWDRARTSWANGDMLGAAVGTTEMLAEAAITGATFGSVGAARHGLARSTEIAVEGSASTKAATKTVEAARAPIVGDQKLANIVKDLYKGVRNPNRFGDGTAMAAAKYELETGSKVFGKDHVNKVAESLRALQRWERNAPDSVSLVDRQTAADLIGQLRGILGYK